MATPDSRTEVLPHLLDEQPGFDPAIRGYDRIQVDHYLARLDDELRAAIVNRDAMASRNADMAAQLASAQGQLESLRRQLGEATVAVTADNVDEHVRRKLAAATADAAAMRATAQAEAALLTADIATLRAEGEQTFRMRLSEAEQYRAEVRAWLDEQTAAAQAENDRRAAEAHADATRVATEAQAEVVRLHDEAAAERERLDEESLLRRRTAEQDFEITLRRRRTAQEQASATEQAARESESARVVAEADRRAAQVRAQASADVERLVAEREGLRRQLTRLHAQLGETIAHAASPTPTSEAESSQE